MTVSWLRKLKKFQLQMLRTQTVRMKRWETQTSDVRFAVGRP